MTDAVVLKDIQTPAGGGGPLLGPTLPRLAAWLGVRLIGKPLRLGGRVIAARHAQVSEVLNRDLDFRIGPVNAKRIDKVNGSFVLGMDRSDRLAEERRALYGALSAMDFPARASDAGERADALIAGAQGGAIDVVGGYARRVAGGTAQRLFGVSGPDEATFLEVARAIFAHTFLNLGGDKAIEARAVKAAMLMRAWLTDEIARRRAAGQTGDDLMGALMGELSDDDAVRRLLGGMLVGSVDTTATTVAKIVFVMGRDRRLRAAARRDADDPTLLLGWCREALRCWPHNPILLREAAADTTLDGVAVPAGAQVFIWTQAAMLDADAFPAPDSLQPDRPAGAYLHFGGGLHPCAGRALNDLQVPMLVGRLLSRGLAKVGSVSWAGPFPARLMVQLEHP